MVVVKLKNICNFMRQACFILKKKQCDSGHRPNKEKKDDIWKT
jgi:hypothetical protein